MEEKIKKNSLFQLLSEVYVASIVFIAIIRNNYQDYLDQLMMIMLLMGVGLITYFVLCYRVDFGVILLYSALLLCALLNKVFVRMASLKEIAITFIVYIPIAIFVFTEKKLNVNFWKTFYIAVTICIMWKWLHSVDGYLLFPELSRNYISIILLLPLYIYVVACSKANKNLPIWSVLLYLGCCVSAIGRGGILAGCVFLFLYMLWWLLFKQDNVGDIKVLKVSLFIILGFALVVFLLFGLNPFLARFFPRFVDGTGVISDGIRIGMLTDYLKSLGDPKNLLLGSFSRDLNPELALRYGNLHNSYFMFHAHYGLVGTVLLIYYIIASCIKLFSRKEFVLLMFFLVFLVRALTDHFFTLHYGEMILWYYFLYYIDGKSNIKIVLSS